MSLLNLDREVRELAGTVRSNNVAVKQHGEKIEAQTAAIERNTAVLVRIADALEKLTESPGEPAVAGIEIGEREPEEQGG